MKKPSLKRILISLIILLSTVGISTADDNFSIPVSCSIPAVPGLNAPALTEGATGTELTISSNGDTGIKNPDSPSVIQEDSKEEIILAEGRPATVTTETIYKR